MLCVAEQQFRAGRRVWSQGHCWPSDFLGRCWIISKPFLHCSRAAGPLPCLACALTVTGILSWGYSLAHMRAWICVANQLPVVELRMWFLSLLRLLSPSELFTSLHFVTSVLCCALESFVPVSRCSNISIHSGVCKYTHLWKIGMWYLEQLCSIQITHLIRHGKESGQATLNSIFV